MNNPLLAPFRLPAFDRIRPEHLAPALDRVLRENERLIEAAARAPSTWDNVVLPLEAASDRLARVWGPIRHLHAVRDEPALRAAYTEALPRLSAYYSWLGQNAGLYAAYTRLAELDWRGPDGVERKASLAHALHDFRLSGIELPAAEQARFREIDARLSELSNRFTQQLMDATDAFSLPVTDDQLQGLPHAEQARARAEGARRQAAQPVLVLDGPTYQAVMMHAEDRDLRETFYRAWTTRASDQAPEGADHDNRPLMDEILALRHEQAQLLGYASWAERQLTRRMAGSVTEVETFLGDLADRSRAQAQDEYDALVEHGREALGLAQPEAWDLAFIAEHQRQARYAISQEQLRPYFPVERVLAGLFEIVGRLFGIVVQHQTDYPVWHPDVRVYEVRRKGSEALVGRFYLDLYARRHKRGGAWMDGWIGRRLTSAGAQAPVAFLTCNFAAPEQGPALLDHDEVTTLFHEFGHGLHHLLTQVDVADVAGINAVAWDAVELPSQFLENWCWQPEALELISGHYETGESLPRALLDRLLAARNFQSAMMMLRQVELALFDLRLHSGPPPADIHALMTAVRDEVAVVHPPVWNRFENGFAHIFAGGYAAGYYSYKWAEVLSADAFGRFEEAGLFDAEAGNDFRRCILERGGSEPAAVLFRRFRGRDPSVTALLRHSGIAAGQ